MTATTVTATAPETEAQHAAHRRRKQTMGAVLLLSVGVIAWSLGTGLDVIAGVLLVGALVLGLPLVVKGIKPLAELGSALLPLTLPLFVVVLVGTDGLPPVFGFILSAICAAAAWVAILEPEYDRAADAFRGQGLRGAIRKLWRPFAEVFVLGLVLVLL